MLTSQVLLGVEQLHDWLVADHLGDVALYLHTLASQELAVCVGAVLAHQVGREAAPLERGLFKHREQATLVTRVGSRCLGRRVAARRVVLLAAGGKLRRRRPVEVVAPRRLLKWGRIFLREFCVLQRANSCNIALISRIRRGVRGGAPLAHRGFQVGRVLAGPLGVSPVHAAEVRLLVRALTRAVVRGRRLLMVRASLSNRFRVRGRDVTVAVAGASAVGRPAHNCVRLLHEHGRGSRGHGHFESALGREAAVEVRRIMLQLERCRVVIYLKAALHRREEPCAANRAHYGETCGVHCPGACFLADFAGALAGALGVGLAVEGAESVAAVHGDEGVAHSRCLLACYARDLFDKSRI